MLKITFEEFIISALLKFNRLDKFDIAYLINILKTNDIEIIKETKLDKIRLYIESEDGFIKIAESLTLNDEVDYNVTLEKYMKKLENNKVKEIFDNLDIKEFILRKVKKYGTVRDYLIKRVFNKKQESELYKLNDKRYIHYRFNDDIPYNEYKEYFLSTKGELELFKKDYKNDIDSFINLLKENNYDDSLLDDFLMKQNLSLSPYIILTIPNFLEFCSIYDRNQYKIEAEENYSLKLKQSN